MSHSLKTKSGFTILELALAMAFISFLLLAIGLVSAQITVVYQKGITIKVVNDNGRELIDEFSRTILASRYDAGLDEQNQEHYEYTYTQTRGSVSVRGEEREVQLHGAFCTGAYSYIWNTGYALKLDQNDPENNGKLAKLDIGTVEKNNFRLARVNDIGRAVCRNRDKNTYKADGASNYVEILSPSENDLALYDFIVYKPAYYEGTNHALFSASFILGTLSGNADINVAGNFCEAARPTSFASDYAYCSINKFNFAARATGGLKI